MSVSLKKYIKIIIMCNHIIVPSFEKGIITLTKAC